MDCRVRPSYLGHCKMANTHKLWQSLWNRHPWLGQYFEFDAVNRRVEPIYKVPQGFNRAAQQYRYFRWRFRDDVVLFQVGRFFEFYDHRDARIAQLLGLQRMRRNPRGARYGFPIGALSRHGDVLLSQSRPITVIRQSDDQFTRIRHRIPANRVEPIEMADRH